MASIVCQGARQFVSFSQGGKTGATLGIIDDFWQRAVNDVGLAGPDRGQGGKYLLLPPGYDRGIPSEGYFVVRATMNDHNFIIRGIVQNGDVAGASSWPC